MRVLIEDGPHEGAVDVAAAPDQLDLVDTDPVVGTVTWRYDRVRPCADDFVRGFEARYRWAGLSPSQLPDG